MTNFTWSRLCIICREWFPEPEDDGWTTVPLGDGSGAQQYWRCPRCSESQSSTETFPQRMIRESAERVGAPLESATWHPRDHWEVLFEGGHILADSWQEVVERIEDGSWPAVL